jgi:hypothetical protein
VSEFRIEKRRAEAALTLTTGSTVRGCFFLSGSSASHAGPERVADLLNAETGFFPFELNAGTAPYTVLFNRSQVLQVTLLEDTIEAQLDPGYSVATERAIRMLLSNGDAVIGRVRVYRPSGSATTPGRPRRFAMSKPRAARSSSTPITSSNCGRRTKYERPD